MVDLLDRLGIEVPVFQGAMGAVSLQELVTAVSSAGGLGTLGYLPPKLFEKEILSIKERLGDVPFAANILLPVSKPGHVDICIRQNVPIVTLFCGFNRNYIHALKEAGITVLFQVGDLAEAKRVIDAGVDGLIVQGFEAGGHVRGTTYLADLLPQIRETFPDRMVVGAGGIHDRASAISCRKLGADAVCSGTRFLASPECYAHDAYKKRLIEAKKTVLTNLFGLGWRDPHRVVPNEVVKKWCTADGGEPNWLRIIHILSEMIARISSSEKGIEAIVGRQSLSLPFYTPASLSPGMEEEMIELVAVYAGKCVDKISSLAPAATIVDELCTK